MDFSRISFAICCVLWIFSSCDSHNKRQEIEEAVKDTLTENTVTVKEIEVPIADNNVVVEEQRVTGTTTKKKVNLKRKNVIQNVITGLSTATVAETVKASDSEIFKAKKPSVFKIDNSKDTVLYCEEGTVLKFQKYSFVYPVAQAGLVDSVDIKVTEYYQISDILLANLSTTSGGELLETGGMLNIEAEKNGKPLVLKKGSGYGASFSKISDKDSMSMFYGDWEDGNIDWKPVDAAVEQAVDTVGRTSAIYTVVEQMPEFPGGPVEMMKYLQKNIRYPREAAKAGVQGNVFVNFVVDCTGQIHDVVVAKGIGFGCDEEALRVVSAMEKWNPGKQDGKKVSVKYTLPIRYKISDIDTSSTDNRLINTVSTSNALINSAGKESNYTKISRKDSLYRTVDQALTLNRLTWINCDRFYKSGNTLNYFVKSGSGSIITIRIIFKDIKSIMPPRFKDSGYDVFPKIPKNYKIVIVAVKFEGNKKYLAIKHTVTGKKTEDNLIFEEVTEEEMKLKIKELNKLWL